MALNKFTVRSMDNSNNVEIDTVPLASGRDTWPQNRRTSTDACTPIPENIMLKCMPPQSLRQQVWFKLGKDCCENAEFKFYIVSQLSTNNNKKRIFARSELVIQTRQCLSVNSRSIKPKHFTLLAKYQQKNINKCSLLTALHSRPSTETWNWQLSGLQQAPSEGEHAAPGWQIHNITIAKKSTNDSEESGVLFSSRSTTSWNRDSAVSKFWHGTRKQGQTKVDKPTPNHKQLMNVGFLRLPRLL